MASKRRFDWIIRLGVWSIALIVLAGLVYPAPRDCGKKAVTTQALNHAHQIGLCLLDFDSDYGKFPDATTITAVNGATGSTWDLKTDTSNDLFKQLFAAGITASEEMFYAKVSNCKKFDTVITPHNKALEARECGFAYITGGSSKSDPARPVVVAPLIPGTLKFDPVAFDGKAILLHPDGSAGTLKIQPDGRVLTVDGRDIFDPSQPYWGGMPFDVKWPAP